MRRRTSSCAASSNIPFGSPLCLSFEISPPNVGVFLSMPPRFKAAVFATEPCPSARPRITGLFGATLSRSQRGKYRRFPMRFDPAAPGNPFAGFCLAHSRFQLREKVFEARVPSRFNVISRKPTPDRC